MNQQRTARISFWITFTCVILFGLMLQSASGQGTSLTRSSDTDNHEQFLPVVMKPFPFTTSLISVASNGIQGNYGARISSISTDGRYVAFSSYSNNLVTNDINNSEDVFVHDRLLGQTNRVSVASDGTEGNSPSGEPSISADGRYVAFYSYANNLVPNDINNTQDVFVHDRLTGQTGRVSVASDGTEGVPWSRKPSISANGRYVAFYSSAWLVNNDTNGVGDIYVHDRQTGQTSRVSVASDGMQGNDFSDTCSISADGRYVVFSSLASNLVSNDTNDHEDAFVHDRLTGKTSRISVASDGTQANASTMITSTSISADGRYAVFSSTADNLVNSDTNYTTDVFVHDLQTGQTNLVSVAPGGNQGNGPSQNGSISGDGRYVSFNSSATNLVSPGTQGDINVFLYDRLTGQINLISVAFDGISGGDDTSLNDSISGDGRYVAFSSMGSNLVSSDTNNTWDVFVHDRGE